MNHSGHPSKMNIRASQISLAGACFVLVLKLAGFYMSRSQAVLSDALETIVNVVAATAALWVMYVVSRPADEEHPYGHGKAEYFSAAFEGGLIFFAAIMISVEAIRALITGAELQNIEAGIWFSVTAAGVNLILGLYLRHIGKKNNSEVLKASGTHVLSDVWTTAGAIIGLGIVLLTGFEWIDPLAALATAAVLGISGFGIVRKSVGALMDEQDKESLICLKDSLSKNKRPGIIDIHELRIQRFGVFHHVDAHVVVPEFWDVAKTHDFVDKFEEDVVRDYRFEGEIAFHLDPCGRAYCKHCELGECPIRKKPFESSYEISERSLIGRPRYDIKTQG